MMKNLNNKLVAIYPRVKELRAQGLSIRQIEKTLKAKYFLWVN
jgi:hypothetical protein